MKPHGIGRGHQLNNILDRGITYKTYIQGVAITRGLLGPTATRTAQTEQRSGDGIISSRAVNSQLLRKVSRYRKY